MVEDWLIVAARRRVAEFSASLRSAGDASLPVPNLAWTVTDLAQHVAGLPGFWGEQNAAQSNWDLPMDFAAFSDAARAHITETQAAPLADLIDSEFDSFITELEHDQEQRWLYGTPTTTPNMCGLILNELILHGRDLAAVTSAPAPVFERNEANAAADAMMATVPCFIDENKAAAKPDGVYHVHFRSGHDYTWTKAGGVLSVELGKPASADAHLHADPAAFLMASLGRMGQVRAALSGKMVTYGRKPWRFLGLGKMAVDGV